MNFGIKKRRKEVDVFLYKKRRRRKEVDVFLYFFYYEVIVDF